MDKSIAMLLATLIGGLISSVTAYFVAAQSLKNKLKEMSVNKLFSAIENSELFVIRIMSGADATQEEVNAFIANCTWLPEDASQKGLDLAKNYLNNKSTEGANEFHQMLSVHKKKHIDVD